MVGSKSEHGGIIKDGAKMVNAVSNVVTVIVGNPMGQEIMRRVEKHTIPD
jgi:acetyl-CoA carboxylase carboxyltransferase component